jgi:hypothetical protein
LKKTKDILIIVFAFLVVFAIGFVIIGINIIQDKYEGKSELTELNNSENVTSPIVGKWLVLNSTVLPFEHISYCDKLNLNSVFEFKKDRTLNVYEKLEGKTCTKDQTYKVRGMKLVILEWDVAFEYEIKKLTSDTLQIKIERTPSYFWTETDLSDRIVKEKLEDIKENGIIVTLERIKNGG